VRWATIISKPAFLKLCEQLVRIFSFYILTIKHRVSCIEYNKEFLWAYMKQHMLRVSKSDMLLIKV